MLKFSLIFFASIMVFIQAHSQSWSSIPGYELLAGHIERLESFEDSLLIYGVQGIPGYEEGYGALILKNGQLLPYGLPEINGAIIDIQDYGDYTYVGGAFSDYPDGMQKIFRVNSSGGLESVGQGSCSVVGAVRNLTVYNDLLIASTDLPDIDCQEDIDWMGMAAWDGESWIPIGGIWAGGGPTPYQTLIFNNKLFVLGKIGYISQDNSFENLEYAYNIAYWDGSVWGQPELGVNDRILDAVISPDGTSLIMGGVFTGANGVPVNKVVSWDMENWEPLGNGLPGTVFCLEYYNGYLFAGGSNLTPLGEHMAVFDGEQWYPIQGGSPDYFVLDMEVHDGDLYVSGTFDQVAGVNAVGLAKYHLEPDESPVSVIEQGAQTNKYKLEVYPNPSGPQTSIGITLPKGESAELVIHDLQGRELYSKEVSSSDEKIEVVLNNRQSEVLICELRRSATVVASTKWVIK